MSKYFAAKFQRLNNIVWLAFFCFIYSSATAALPFTATPLSATLQTKLKSTDLWQTDCPVKLENLQLLSISYYDFSGHARNDGTLILNKSIAPAALAAFKSLYAIKFPFAGFDTLIRFNGDWRKAEAHNISYGFRCNKNKSGKFVPESSGMVLTINPVQNPAVLWTSPPPAEPTLWCKVLHPFCRHLFTDPEIGVFPSAGMLAVNRRLQIKGMVESITPIFSQYGFSWSGTSNQQINWKKFFYSR